MRPPCSSSSGGGCGGPGGGARARPRARADVDLGARRLEARQRIRGALAGDVSPARLGWRVGSKGGGWQAGGGEEQGPRRRAERMDVGNVRELLLARRGSSSSSSPEAGGALSWGGGVGGLAAPLLRFGLAVVGTTRVGVWARGDGVPPPPP
jgi:hypothetical protein